MSIRKSIDAGFENLAAIIYRRPKTTLLLAIIFAAALISGVPKLRFDTSTEGFLHNEDPVLLAYNDFREQFGRDELILVAIEAPDIFAESFLERLRELHNRLDKEVPHVDDITSLINARVTRGANDELIVEDLLDPWPDTDEARQTIRTRAKANPLYQNTLISADGKIATVVIKSNAYSTQEASADEIMDGFGDDNALAFDSAEEPVVERQFLNDAENRELVGAVQEIVADFDAADFHIYFAGSPVVNDVLKAEMQRNMKQFMMLAILAIGAILFALFRRISGVVLPLLIVVVSLVSTVGGMGHAGIPFKLPTSIMPSFLLAVGVGAAVHILALFYRRIDRGGVQGSDAGDLRKGAIAYAVGHSGLAVLMTSLTTAAGLASFAGASIAPISDLGYVSSLGVMLSFFYTIVLLPAILSVVPIRPRAQQDATADVDAREPGALDRMLTSIATLTTSRPTPILIVTALISALGIAGMNRLTFSHKPYEWFPEDDPARVATELIDSRLGGASTVEVILDTGKENGLYEPEIMNGLEKLSRRLEAIDHGDVFVGKVLSLADILKEINRALNDNKIEHYSIPDSRELIAQEFLLFENSGSDDLDDFVDSQFSKARFTARTPWVDAVFYSDFLVDLEVAFEEVFKGEADIQVTGMAALLGRTMRATITSMITSYTWALLVITGMMLLLIGELRTGLLSMIPNLTPIIVTLGLMGWVGIPINLFTMLIGSIAIGLAVDDTIHFMHTYRRAYLETGEPLAAVNETLQTSGRAMLVTSIVLSVGFLLYGFSSLKNVAEFGFLTGFTVVIALLADFFIAPALVTTLHNFSKKPAASLSMKEESQ